MSETEVEVEDYEEIVGDLYYDDSVEAVPNADSFKEPTLIKPERQAQFFDTTESTDPEIFQSELSRRFTRVDS